MNPETALSLIAALMGKREQSINDKWAIVWRDNAFQCLPLAKVGITEHEFGRYNNEDLTKGLSPRQWNNLKCRIVEFDDRKGFEPCHSRPSQS